MPSRSGRWRGGSARAVTPMLVEGVQCTELPCCHCPLPLDSVVQPDPWVEKGLGQCPWRGFRSHQAIR